MMKVLLTSLLVAVGAYILTGYGDSLQESLLIGFSPLFYYVLGLLIGKECA